MYVVKAAARIGCALQVGELTVTGAAKIVANAAGSGSWETMTSKQHTYWRERATRIIDSISCVGGLLLTEELREDGKLHFFLVDWGEWG
jgi:hypothetical protein